MTPEASGEFATVRFSVSWPFWLLNTTGSETTLPGAGRTGQVDCAKEAAVNKKIISKSAERFFISCCTSAAKAALPLKSQR